MNEDRGRHSLDDLSIRRGFDRASPTYDLAAVLQTQVRTLLLDRLEWTDLKPRIVLDLGAGTGHASRALKRRYPRSTVIALDFSFGMLRAAARQNSWLSPFSTVCAAASHLPLPDASVDLVLSNFMLHWSDLDTVLAEVRRVLAPRGLLSFTTLGPDSLRELRSAWMQGDARRRVLDFLDMHDIGDAVVRAGFAAPVLDVDRYTLFYKNVQALAADLRAAGSCNAASERPKGLTTPRQFAAMQAAYESHRSDGRLPATYEVVFGQAWAPPLGEARSGDDDTHVSLDEVKRQLRRRRAT